jgi:hypothetical protein
MTDLVGTEDGMEEAVDLKGDPATLIVEGVVVDVSFEKQWIVCLN